MPSGSEIKISELSVVTTAGSSDYFPLITPSFPWATRRISKSDLLAGVTPVYTGSEPISVSSASVVSLNISSPLKTTSGSLTLSTNSTLATASGSVGLATSGVTAGSYNQVQVDGYGRVTGGSVNTWVGSSPISVSGSVISLTTSSSGSQWLSGSGTWTNPKSIQIFGGHGNGDAVGASSSEAICPFIAGLAASTRIFPIPVAGTVKNLYIRTASAQPATGTLVVTVYIDLSPTTITLTIAAGAAAGTFSDTAHTASLTAGGAINVVLQNNATADSAIIGGVTFEIDFNTVV